jgi:poly(hydroxyalkanoate) granule-associated protein
MARKNKSRNQSSSSGDSAQAARDSAQKIWLAGLGAFERAKSEGPKMFEMLVRQGRDMGGKARDAADQAMKSVREQANDAGGKWDKLEQVFEERVSRSLGKLGVITGREVNELSRQVQELNESVRDLMAGKAASKPSRGSSPRKKAGAAKSGAKKAGAKRPARKKAAP